MRKRKIKQPKQVGSPLWMTTYADMVTLLLCFFVLLYGISNVDAEKFRGLMSSLRGGFGILDGTVVSDETGIFHLHPILLLSSCRNREAVKRVY